MDHFIRRFPVLFLKKPIPACLASRWALLLPSPATDCRWSELQGYFHNLHKPGFDVLLQNRPQPGELHRSSKARSECVAQGESCHQMQIEGSKYVHSRVVQSRQWIILFLFFSSWLLWSLGECGPSGQPEGSDLLWQQEEGSRPSSHLHGHWWVSWDIYFDLWKVDMHINFNWIGDLH